MNTRKTYIAFDAVGVTDHEFSNLPSFLLLERFQRSFPGRFDFINMDEIRFASEHEGQVTTTLQKRFAEKIGEADNVVMVASPMTNASSPILNWQLGRAVLRRRLPLIVAYAHTDHLTEETLDARRVWLPEVVRYMIDRDHAYVAHIPLTVDKLERALASFSARDGLYPWTARTIF